MRTTPSVWICAYFNTILRILVYNEAMLIILRQLSKSFGSYLESEQIEHVVVRPIGSAQGNSNSMTRANLEADFKNYDSLLSTVRDAQPTAILTDYEHYVKPAAQLSRDLGLPAISVESAERCTDKNRMRKAFHAYDPSITPDFMRVLTEDDLERFVAEHDFPVMLKPTNLLKSLFITKNASLAELRENYREMQKQLPDVLEKLQALEEPEVIVEEFLDGTMHTVAGFADSEGAPHLIPDIVDIQTGRDRGSNENYLYSRMLPSTLDADTQSAVLEVAKKGIRALDMKNSAAHVEIIVTKNGPKLIEIGARPGGYRPRMYSEALGIDFYAAFINAVSGRTIDLSPSKTGATCTIEIFPDRRGIISEITNKAALEKLGSITYLSYRIPEGEEAGLPSQGFKSSVIVTLVADSSEQLRRDKAFIDENVRVITT